MAKLIRKISVGKDYKNDAMHYAVGQEVYGGHTICDIIEEEDRKDERTKIQATQQSEMIEQRKSGKPPKNFESAGNDILGGGFDLGAFDPR